MRPELVKDPHRWQPEVVGTVPITSDRNFPVQTLVHSEAGRGAADVLAASSARGAHQVESAAANAWWPAGGRDVYGAQAHLHERSTGYVDDNSSVRV